MLVAHAGARIAHAGAFLEQQLRPTSALQPSWYPQAPAMTEQVEPRIMMPPLWAAIIARDAAGVK